MRALRYVPLSIAMLLVAAPVAMASVTIDSGPPAFTNSSSAHFTFSTNPSAPTECKVDNATPYTSCTSPYDLNGVSEGSHTFYVRPNAGGAPPAAQTRQWTADFTPPDTSMTNAPPDLTNSTTATFEFSSPDSSAGFECSLNGSAFSTCSSPVVYSGLSDGARDFSVRAVDPAGNVDVSPPSKHWTVDTTPPDTTITAGPPPQDLSTVASFAFTAGEAAAFECSDDGAPFAPCTSPHGINYLKDGAHTFAVRAIDSAGNTDPTPATRAWTLDTVAPAQPTLNIGPYAPRAIRRGHTRHRPVVMPGFQPVSLNSALHSTAHVQIHRFLRVQWSIGTRRLVSGVKYRLDYAVLKPGGTYVTQTSFPVSKASGAEAFHAIPGREYCFDLVARDKAGNESDSSKCTALPVKASTFKLYGFVANKGPGYYENQHITAKAGGGETVLNLGFGIESGEDPIVVRVALVATKCPTCGKVKISFLNPDDYPNSEDVTVNLHSTKTRHSQVIQVALLQGNLSQQNVDKIVIETKSGTPQIEGLGISAD
jgi:hypothetical protein